MQGADDRLRLFEALVRASPDFVAVASIDGKVEFLNAAGRRLVGIGPDVDVTETAIVDYLTPEGLVASIEVEQPAVVRDGSWSGETTLRNWRDDSAIPVAVTSFVVTDLSTGEPIAMATIQHDLREVHAASTQAAEAGLALQRTEARQRALLRHMSDLVLVIDADLLLTYASPAATLLLGYPEGSRLGTSILDLVHPDEREAAAAVLAGLLEVDGAGPPLRVRVLTATGEALHYEARGNNLLREPSVGGIIISARDVTDSYLAERSQADVAEVLELIASEAPVDEVLHAIVTWVERQTGHTRCTVLLTEAGVPHRTLRDGASPSMPDAYRRVIAGLDVSAAFSPCAVAVSSSVPVLVPDLLADPRWAPFHAVAAECGVRACWSYPITSPASGATLGSFALYDGSPGLPDQRTEALVARASHLVGITVDRTRLLARLEHQALHDALTLLPNRLQLIEELTHALHVGPAPVVLFLDLDRLKVINDSLGHDVGDELLISVAERLRDAVGEEHLVARFGGDEFVVLSTTTTDAPSAIALAEQVLATVSQTVELEGRLITPSASIGVVIAADSQTASAVLRDADIAMYRAKQRGGGGFEVFGEHMRQRAFDRLDLEGQIRNGLAAGEFRVLYQPVVDLSQGDLVVGFEALVRWQHPERGLLAPDAFLQLAEETGLIVPLGEWVLRTATATALRWREEGLTDRLTMSVNVAAQQLTSAELLPLVRQSADLIAPWTLGLELTESTLMDDTAVTLEALDALADAGGHLSIDDFGTGFSSLSYLTRLPVHRLKIDRVFVADLASKAASAVAATIVSLAKQLALTAIAEGIETSDQRSRLVDMGCRYGQGYLFSRPVPEDEAVAMLRRQAR